MFRQITKKIDDDKLNQHIFIKYDIPYSKWKEVHYYNELGHDEIGFLIVKKSHMRLKNNYYNSFFLENYNEILSR